MNSIQNKTLGIMGDGQLAKMLTHSAQKLGMKVSIYSESSAGPATTIADAHTRGLYSNTEKVKSWASTCDKITFESEFIELKKVKTSKFSPSIKSMNLLRDRFFQKKLLQEFKIPTSPFYIPDESTSLTNPLVLKKRLYGYDGFGTVICKNEIEYNNFLKTKPTFKEWIAEDFIPFKRELAFSISRDSKNNFCSLPLVETFQKDSKCFWVKGPVSHPKLKNLLPKIKKLLTHLNYQGIMAFEFFETKSSELIVNEVAPRVHNSAHYSIEGLQLSQFDVHILSIFNTPLPLTIKAHQNFAMVNLIGTSKRKPQLQIPKNGSLHWYGKKENRPGRKMGHLTFLDKTPKTALKLALYEEKKQNL